MFVTVNCDEVPSNLEQIQKFFHFLALSVKVAERSNFVYDATARKCKNSKTMKLLLCSL